MSEITAALIVAGISFVGVIITAIVIVSNNRSNVKKNDFDILRGLVDELKKSVEELEEKNNDLSTQLKAKDERIKELENASAKKDLRISEMQCEIDKLRSEINALQPRKKATGTLKL